MRCLLMGLSLLWPAQAQSAVVVASVAPPLILSAPLLTPPQLPTSALELPATMEPSLVLPSLAASPLSELGVLRSAVQPGAPQPAQALSASFDGAVAPRASFFFNDHDASTSYAAPLKSFVGRHDEILVEMAKPGREIGVYQSVSDGVLTPAQGRRKLKIKTDSLEDAILKAVHRTKRLMRPEAIHYPRNAPARRAIDEELLPKAGALLEQAYDEFIDDGDAAAAARTLHQFNAAMVEVHTLREKALVEDLSSRLRQPGSVGVIFGMFHTQPYQALKRAGLPVEREFHPAGKDGNATFSPMIIPLRRIRFDKPSGNSELETKETLSFLLFHFFLDPLFRMDKYAGRKDETESEILKRMKVADFQRLADEASAYAAEKGDAEVGDRRVALFILRWLGDEGFLQAREAPLFRRR